MSVQRRQGFWAEAFALHGAVAPRVMPHVLIFGTLACGICGLVWLVEAWFHRRFTLDITPHELAGAALGVLLVVRTNAGYDRWWEARKLWGGFVDRCRNVCIGAMSYGPTDSEWRGTFARWVAAYPHVARHSLRNERPSTDVANLLGKENAERIANADHMPSLVALKLGGLLREAREKMGMDGFAFLQVDRERALLIDNYGGCERILNTPLPRVYSVEIRRLIVLYLLTLPFALLHRLESDWIVPLITMLVAYPLLSLDQIGVELENPFVTANLSHLPIDDISAAIERNVLGLLKTKQSDALADASDPSPTRD
jgi:ion channel-forming bestrophin family protein